MSGNLNVTDGLYPELEEAGTGVKGIGFEALAAGEQSNGKMDDAAAAPSATSESIELLEERKKSMTENEKKLKEQTMFFDDERRRIDFVLTYSKEDDLSEEAQEAVDAGDESALEGRSSPLSSTQKSHAKKMIKRHTFLKNMAKHGLEYEIQDCCESPDRKTYFVKVHAKFDALLSGAEELLLRMPIRPNTIHAKTYRERFFDGIKLKDPMLVDVPESLEIEDYFTAPFKVERKDLFHGIEDEAKFFSTAQRSQVTWHIMHNIQYAKDEDQVGIRRLMSNGTFNHVFPLHEGSHTVDKGEEVNTDRQFLYYNWYHPKKFYKDQPLDYVRRYFGEKVAIYFAWVGFYTLFLVPATLVGMVVMLYGLSTLVESRNFLARDYCNETYRELFYMCPLCDDGCDFWYLLDTCLFSRASLLFDNGATVFFAGFMALWGVLFLEFWKRRQFQLQYDWDMLGFEDAEERARPEFEQKIKRYVKKCKTAEGKKKFKVYNPVLERNEYIQPAHWFWPKLILTFSVLTSMVLVVLGIVISVLIYRVAIAGLIYRAVSNISGGPSVADLFVSISGACLQLVAIIIMNKVYEWLAYRLTDWELHRTQTEYDDSFTIKMYIFQFANFYSSLFYIAFFKGTLVGYPGNYTRIGSLRLDECSTYGCMLELTIQLGIIFVGKQLLNDCTELGIPLAKRIFRCLMRKEQTEEDVFTRWEKDFELVPVGEQGLFYEYLELVLQYGFVTIFVAAFPLAPFFALLNNIIEIRLDAFKFLTVFRRPVAVRYQDIGAWYGILDVVSKFSVVTNAWLIAVTSSFIPHEVFQYQYQTETNNNYADWSLGTFNTFSLIAEGSFPSPITADLLFVDENEQDTDVLYLPFVDFACLSNQTGKPITNFTQDQYQEFFNTYKDNEALIFDFDADSQCRDNRANCRINGTKPCFLNSTVCRFRGLVNEGGVRPIKNYETLIARLAFVILFEHIIFILGGIIAFIIPDVPEGVQNEIKREKLLALEAVQTRHAEGKALDGEGGASGQEEQGEGRTSI